MITQERLKELFHYDPETGLFTRIKSYGNRKKGTTAGWNNLNGYLRIDIDKGRYYCHRLAWLYVYGEMPKHFIDHINGKPSDNRIENLRDVVQAMNMQNVQKPQPSNKLGIRGVYERRGKFSSQIRSKGKVKYVGDFATPELAKAAYLEAKREIMERELQA